MNDPNENGAQTLAAFAQLQTLIEGEKKPVGLVFALVVEDETSPTGMVMHDGAGGLVNMGFVAQHFMSKAQSVYSEQMSKIHDRVAKLEASAEAELAKLEGKLT